MMKLLEAMTEEWVSCWFVVMPSPGICVSKPIGRCIFAEQKNGVKEMAGVNSIRDAFLAGTATRESIGRVYLNGTVTGRIA